MEPLRRALRGYEPAQVDRLVSGLYSQLESQLREVEALRAQLQAGEVELTTRREQAAALEADRFAVQGALVSAHRQAEEVLARARKDAETLLEVAREAASRYQEDLRGRIDDLNWQIERLTLQKQRFQLEFRGLLEQNLVQLSEPALAITHPSGSRLEAAAEAPLDADPAHEPVPEPAGLDAA